jgi:hypothetical protein
VIQSDHRLRYHLSPCQYGMCHAHVALSGLPPTALGYEQDERANRDQRPDHPKSDSGGGGATAAKTTNFGSLNSTDAIRQPLIRAVIQPAIHRSRANGRSRALLPVTRRSWRDQRQGGGYPRCRSGMSEDTLTL